MLPAGCEAAAKPESMAHHEVERSERLASGTRTLYEVRPRA